LPTLGARASLARTGAGECSTGRAVRTATSESPNRPVVEFAHAFSPDVYRVCARNRRRRMRWRQVVASGTGRCARSNVKRR
jgi:hypothetical protein